jgi:hypothetical protein
MLQPQLEQSDWTNLIKPSTDYNKNNCSEKGTSQQISNASKKG